MQFVHATSLKTGPCGILLRGPSGSGKSDLALRLIDRGATLVADDQTCLTVCDGRLVMNPPKEIAAKIEIRGYGITQIAYDRDVPLDLVVDLKDRLEIERMPEYPADDFFSMPVAYMQIDPFEISAVEKILTVIESLKI